MNEQPISVSEFLRHANDLLASIPVFVEGEVADVRVSQGKWLHLDLKDEEEDALVHCFAPVFRIRTPLEDGMRVRVRGTARIYPRFGKFSIVLQEVHLSGEGALRRAFEILRKKLEHEGLFDTARKRSLPRFPERIALITSPQAAAYNDFLKVLGKRRGGIEILFLPVSVQGRDAPAQIIGALEHLNEDYPDVDALVLVRGGGNLEDLHAFNDEPVVRAIARSRIPTLVGVGHERDITLADLVADIRASTPSNAAELLTPTKEEIAQHINRAVLQLRAAVRDVLDDHHRAIARAVAGLRESVQRPLRMVESLSHRMASQRRVFSMEITRRSEALLLSRRGMIRAYDAALREQRDRVAHSERVLASLHPKRVLERGYSITKAADGSVVRNASGVAEGDPLTTVLHRGILESIVCPSKPSTSRKRTKSWKKSSGSLNQGTLM